jgi:FAD synthetase
VDEAILGYENMSLLETIKKLKPDIMAVGYDQKGIEEEVRKVIDGENMNIRVVRIGRFGSADLDSSSKIKRKILILNFNKSLKIL